MGHGHGHGVAEQAASASGKHVRKLWIAVGLGLVTFVTQVIVGLSTSSLALLSDSAHLFTDVFGILMALTAILLAQRARSRPDRTFGMYRAEVFAALFNALLLFGVAGWVLYEALGRLSDPPEVPGLPVSIVAVVGLVMNIAAFLLLRSGAKESINVRGAYLEVMADMLGSVGVLISGLVTLIFGWRYADPVIGVAIGLFVLPRAYNLGRHALRILLQHAPAGVSITEVTQALQGIPGVKDAHDLHIWTLTSGMEVASAHLTIDEESDPTKVLAAAQDLLATQFNLVHATLQVEPAAGDGRCQELPW
ncbi:cation diffusion facilitator family transporter [Rhodococcus sp. EPR-134]|uniref:cation diffusion facilitator family transporter n=1 Tax=Rhodococcus sp. EPR-134 TaxID=1813675 RepID=UPI0007BC090E|nr:cation diffusion facilitator family transporter [Rhodococcus sp. EPR-134]KZF15981.1 cation transporter [Rhodococcus sp. EPR-134]